MIVVDYPDNSCRKFFWFENLAFGPVDSNGDYRAVQVDLPLREERFEPKKGIYDENDIIHSSFHGRIFYYPILADCVPYPQPGYPRSLRVPVMETPFLKDTLCGFACPDIGALVSTFPPAQCVQVAIRRPGPRNWTMTRVYTVNPTSTTAYVYVWNITFLRWITPVLAEISYTYRYSVSPVPWSHGMSQSATCETIEAAASAVTRWSSTTSATKQRPGHTTNPSAVVSPGRLAQNLEVFVDDLINREFPIKEKNYGDMAASAVKQRRVIDTNLFEFLRDLRHAKSMIPKLKNLSKLATHANNLLAVDYGIMPTIRDLKQIVGAFEALKPFLDKFGNIVYNSSNKVEVTTSSGRYYLEQYIKVPVANEDSQLLQLMDQLDKYGFGLTFENVWDLVKYSFVIDWFVDVGGFLERVDNNLRLLRYNIPYVTMSRKKAVTGEIPQTLNLATIGPIEWRYYHRWVTSQCPLPPLTLSTTPTVSNHWLEAGALIIQRAK